MTIYFGQSATGLSRFRYIFFYGWDSYVLFKKGRPEKRGNFSSLSSFISYNFLSKDHLNQIQPQRLRGHVFYLPLLKWLGDFQRQRWSESPIIGDLMPSHVQSDKETGVSFIMGCKTSRRVQQSSLLIGFHEPPPIATKEGNGWQENSI